MIDYFQNLTSAPLTTLDFITNLIVAFICGLIHITFYRIAYRGPGYSVSFLNSLVLLTVITALVIMVIGDSLARAFGLVGAMSIVRFRTAVKEVLDIVHIFLALAIGMTAGVGLTTPAILGTVLLGIIYYLLVSFNVISPSSNQFVVQFTYNSNGDTNGHEPSYIEKLQKHSKQFSLMNVRSVGENDDTEISYYVKPKSNNGASELIKELKRINGVKSVLLFKDEEQF